MAPNPLFYQLLLAALVFICLLIHLWCPDDPRHPSTTSRCAPTGGASLTAHGAVSTVRSLRRSEFPPFGQVTRTDRSKSTRASRQDGGVYSRIMRACDP